MSKRKLVLLLLLTITMIVFLAAPMTAMATSGGGPSFGGTDIHLKNNSAPSISSVTVYFNDESSLMLYYSFYGNEWRNTDPGKRDIDDIDHIAVNFFHGDPCIYNYPDDFGQRGGPTDLIEYSVEGKDKCGIYLWLNCPGSLTIHKNVTNVNDPDSEVMFEFTVTGKTLSAPIVVYASEAEPVYLDLAPGKYRVTETADPDYTTVKTSIDVKIKAGKGKDITFCNTLVEVPEEKWDLTINKDVLGMEDDTVFTFDVYTWDGEDAGDLVAEDVGASEDEPGLVEGLDAGWYIVYEDDADGYTAEYPSIVVQVGDGRPNGVCFQNCVDTEPDYDLTITKDVRESANVDITDDTTFTFDVYTWDGEDAVDLVADNVEAAEGAPGVVDDLQAGWYIVYENGREYYTPFKSYIIVQVGCDLGNQVDFVNYYYREPDTYSLCIHKNVLFGDSDIGDDTEFTFDVYEYSYDTEPSLTASTTESLMGERGDLVEEDVPASEGEENCGIVSGLPEGWYEVVEDHVEGYTPDQESIIVYVGGDGCDGEVYFVNQLSILTIYKVVTNVERSEVDFDFTIFKLIDDEWVALDIDMPSASEVDPGTLKLDPGSYKIVEEEEDGYSIADDHSDTGYANVTAGQGASVTFYNTQDEEPNPSGSLTIEKDVRNVSNSSVYFTFDIYQLIDDEEVYIDTVRASETDSYTLALEPGDYIVREDSRSGYRQIDPEQEVTVVEDQKSVLVFENSRRVVSGGGGDDDTTVPQEPTPTSPPVVEPTEEAPPVVVAAEPEVPAAPLPDTGGTETLLLPLLGLSLVAFGGYKLARAKK